MMTRAHFTIGSIDRLSTTPHAVAKLFPSGTIMKAWLAKVLRHLLLGDASAQA
jgi:hypothetical protein